MRKSQLPPTSLALCVLRCVVGLCLPLLPTLQGIAAHRAPSAVGCCPCADSYQPESPTRSLMARNCHHSRFGEVAGPASTPGACRQRSFCSPSIAGKPLYPCRHTGQRRRFSDSGIGSASRSMSSTPDDLNIRVFCCERMKLPSTSTDRILCLAAANTPESVSSCRSHTCTTRPVAAPRVLE